MEQEEYLDRYERILTDGLVKICTGGGYLQGEMLSCPDLDGWWDERIKDYIADAVENFNDYPLAAIGWAAFLGMALAHSWDKGWQGVSALPYTSFYGSRGFDDMDEHILKDELHLKPEYASRMSDTLLSCSQAALALMEHEGIETQTSLGFYALARTYTVMYRLGASIELRRLGYRKVLLNPSDILKRS